LFRAHNYLITPLRYGRAEAEQSVWFWEHGYRCTIGSMASIGGTAPVTLAGAVGLALAETQALSFIHHVFYGGLGLHLFGRPVPLDMRTGVMPYGRPEEFLAGLAMSQIAEYIGALGTGGVGHGTASKLPDVEYGLSKALPVGFEMTMLGELSWNYGLYSTDVVNDPRVLVIENEFVEGLKRLARGFEVNRRALPLEVVREVGPGGQFLSHPHTAEHLRDEIWRPELMSGLNYEARIASGSEDILKKAWKVVLEVFETYHPRGIR